MGGDNAPKKCPRGRPCSKEIPTVEFQLAGTEAKVNACGKSLPNIRVIHCSEKINSDDEPVKGAFVLEERCFNGRCHFKAVKKEADALILRKYGALLTASLLVVVRIKGI